MKPATDIILVSGIVDFYAFDICIKKLLALYRCSTDFKTYEIIGVKFTK